MRINRLLAMGAATVLLIAGVMGPSGAAAAASNPCGGTKVTSKTLKWFDVTLGNATVYNTGTSGSTTHYCIVLNKTISADGLVYISTSQAGSDGNRINVTITKSWTKSQIMHKKDVAHCSSCKSWTAKARIDIPDPKYTGNKYEAEVTFTLS